MSAYYFTGWISQFKHGQMNDSCASLLVYGGNADAAKTKFETWLLRAEKENAIPTKIEKIIFSPVLEEIFTEAGYMAVDWPEICQRANVLLEGIEVDDFEQGGWVDCNQVIGTGKLSGDIDSLRDDLAEEIRSGLNWLPEKQFLFVLSVLVPPGKVELPGENEAAHEENAEFDLIDLRLSGREEVFSELAERKVTVLAQARNSAAAAWLWRKYEVKKQLPASEIRIDLWCGAETV